jgi:hypothetical protein
MRSKACKVVSRCVQSDSKRLPTRLDARPTRLEAPPTRLDALPTRLDARPTRLEARPTRLEAPTNSTRCASNSTRCASNSTRCASNSTRRAYKTTRCTTQLDSTCYGVSSMRSAARSMRVQLDSTRVQVDSMHYTTRLYVLWCQLDALGGSLDALVRWLAVLMVSRRNTNDPSRTSDLRVKSSSRPHLHVSSLDTESWRRGHASMGGDYGTVRPRLKKGETVDPRFPMGERQHRRSVPGAGPSRVLRPVSGGCSLYARVQVQAACIPKHYSG